MSCFILWDVFFFFFFFFDFFRFSSGRGVTSVKSGDVMSMTDGDGAATRLAGAAAGAAGAAGVDIGVGPGASAGSPRASLVKSITFESTPARG